MKYFFNFFQVNTDNPLTVKDSFLEKETKLFSSLKLKIEDLTELLHKLNELVRKKKKEII